jgi:hypothetical protein
MVTKVYYLSITQVNGETFASRDDLDLVYQLDNKIFDDAKAEMHDRQLLHFETDKVTEIGFEHGENSVALRKSGADWKYVTDSLVPIDSQKVTEVINVFRDMKTHRFEDYKATDLAKFGLDKDTQKMWVVLENGQRSEITLSKTGPVNDPDKSRYAMHGPAEGARSAFLLKGDQAAKFNQKLEDFLKTATPAAGATPPPAAPTGSVQ